MTDDAFEILRTRFELVQKLAADAAGTLDPDVTRWDATGGAAAEHALNVQLLLSDPTSTPARIGRHLVAGILGQDMPALLSAVEYLRMQHAALRGIVDELADALAAHATYCCCRCWSSSAPSPHAAGDGSMIGLARLVQRARAVQEVDHDTP